MRRATAPSLVRGRARSFQALSRLCLPAARPPTCVCSEGANLRHIPELLWFLFWAANHSPAMEALWQAGLPTPPAGLHRRRAHLRTNLQVCTAGQGRAGGRGASTKTSRDRGQLPPGLHDPR
jgi:hypothetical protein